MRALIIVVLVAGCGSSGDGDSVDSGRAIADAGAVLADGSVDGGTTSPLADMSDEFETAAIDPAWQMFRGERWTVTSGSGAVTIRLDQGHGGAADSSLWFNANQGSLMFKQVSGDFVASVALRVRRGAPNDDQSPLPSVRLGGLMARDGTAPSENYVFVVTGFDVDDLSVETKDTRDGSSQFIGPDGTGSGDAELRLCRVGDQFRLYYRALGSDTWIPAAVSGGGTGPIVRPDLPSSLQVGLNLYTNQATPDVQMTVDYFRLRRPTNLQDCAVDVAP